MIDLVIRDGVARYVCADGSYAVYVRNQERLASLTEDDLPEPCRTAAIRAAVADLAAALRSRAAEHPRLAWLVDVPCYFIVSADAAGIQEAAPSVRSFDEICSRLRRYERFFALAQEPLARRRVAPAPQSPSAMPLSSSAALLMSVAPSPTPPMVTPDRDAAVDQPVTAKDAGSFDVPIPTTPDADVTLDETVVCTHLHHIRDFLLPDRHVFLDRETGALLSVYEGYEEAPMVTSPENLRLLSEIPASPERYFEVPIPDHAKWQEWFSDFARSMGRQDERLWDIGGWMTTAATDAEHARWEAFSRTQIVAHLERTAAEAGLVVRVSRG